MTLPQDEPAVPSAGGVAAALPVPEAPRMRTAPRWAAPLFCALAMGLVPWTLWLAISLPTRHLANHYDAAWSGFDIALAASLLATGLGLLRHATWTQSVASSAATLLVCDAWFDVTLSASDHEQLVAVATAVLVELPLAIACILVARESKEMAERTRSYVEFVRRLHLRRRTDVAAAAGDRDDSSRSLVE